MSATNVVFVARCDGGCGGDARWSGVRAEPGGATRYIVTCDRCGISGNDGSNDGHTVVSDTAPPPWMNNYWTRLLQPRRTA